MQDPNDRSPRDIDIDDLAGVRDEAEGAQHVPGGTGDDGDRRDPDPDLVRGADDTGAEGRDRDHGGWGDRGIGGGRAGGTGI